MYDILHQGVVYRDTMSHGYDETHFNHRNGARKMMNFITKVAIALGVSQPTETNVYQEYINSRWPIVAYENFRQSQIAQERDCWQLTHKLHQIIS